MLIDCNSSNGEITTRRRWSFRFLLLARERERETLSLYVIREKLRERIRGER